MVSWVPRTGKHPKSVISSEQRNLFQISKNLRLDFRPQQKWLYLLQSSEHHSAAMMGLLGFLLARLLPILRDMRWKCQLSFPYPSCSILFPALLVLLLPSFLPSFLTYFLSFFLSFLLPSFLPSFIYLFIKYTLSKTHKY